MLENLQACFHLTLDWELEMGTTFEFGTFFCQCDQSQNPSEIKQPLAELYVYNSSYHPMMQEGITYGNYMIEGQYQLRNLTL